MGQVEGGGLLNDLSEKRAIMEKVRGVQKDVGIHAEMVDRVRAKLNEDPSLASADYQASIERYEKLKNLVNSTMSVSTKFLKSNL